MSRHHQRNHVLESVLSLTQLLKLDLRNQKFLLELLNGGVQGDGFLCPLVTRPSKGLFESVCIRRPWEVTCEELDMVRSSLSSLSSKAGSKVP